MALCYPQVSPFTQVCVIVCTCVRVCVLVCVYGKECVCVHMCARVCMRCIPGCVWVWLLVCVRAQTQAY